MKQFLICFICVIPFALWFTWFMEGNYGKTTYGNFWNWIRGKKLE